MTRKAADSDERQLRRLETLTDVVFGIVLLRVFLLLPRPDSEASMSSMRDLFEGRWIAFAVIAIGVAFTSIYWIQNNAIFGSLQRTNTRHTAVTIAQLFSLLLFLYTVRLGVEFDGDLLAMIAESVAATVMGALQILNFRYAARMGLLADDVDEGDVKRLTLRLLPEPITAVATIGLAFLGQLVWTIGWFTIGPTVVRIARRRMGVVK